MVQSNCLKVTAETAVQFPPEADSTWRPPQQPNTEACNLEMGLHAKVFTDETA